MNKKLIISLVAMFVLTMGLDFVVHGVLLMDGYSQLPLLYRTPEDSQNYMHFMLLAHVFIAVGMVWIYLEGRKESPWLAQGLRFGLALIVLLAFPTYMIYYAVQPLPATLVAQQIVYDSAAKLVSAVVLAWINR